MIKSSLRRKGLLERGGSNRRHGEDDHEDDHGGDHEDGHGEVDHGGDGGVDDGHDDGCHDNIFSTASGALVVGGVRDTSIPSNPGDSFECSME